jgi:hypothetical protein
MLMKRLLFLIVSFLIATVANAQQPSRDAEPSPDVFQCTVLDTVVFENDGRTDNPFQWPKAGTKLTVDKS